MRRRGITLVEVMLAAAIAALVMLAAGNAYVAGTRTAQTLGAARDTIARRAAFEAELTNLFDHAYVDPDTTDLSSYFLSGDNLSSAATANATGTTGVAASPTSSSAGGASSGTGDNGTLVFTVTGLRLPSTLLSSTDDFETNNDRYGPVAGPTEIQLGTTPVGSPTGGEQGLFMRRQAPADTDPTQGGTESLLSPDIETISFEFYDGTGWQTTWDTATMTPRRLPSAVRVTYKYRDETQSRILVCRIPASDVTTDNPVVETTTTS